MPVEPSAPPVAEAFAKRRPMSSAVVPTTGIRTVFLDVDGTLVTYENVLPDSAAWAIREARRAGHRVYACTGRSRAEMPEAIWAIGLDGMIGGNGAYVEDDGEVLLHQHLSAAQCEQAVSWLRRRGLEPYLEANSGLYASPAFRDAARPAIRAYAIGKGAAGASSMEVDDVLPGMVLTDELVLDDVNKISFLLSSPEDDLAAARRELPDLVVLPERGALGRVAEGARLVSLVALGAYCTKVGLHWPGVVRTARTPDFRGVPTNVGQWHPTLVQ